MKNNIKTLENESDVLSFLNKISYGTTYFVSKNNDAISFLDNCVDLINKSLDKKSLRIEDEKLIDELRFRGFNFGDGLKKVISGVQKEEIPVLSEDSYYIRKYMTQAFNEKRQVRFNLDKSLYNYAKKLAKNNLVFDVDDDGPFFLAHGKTMSIYDQIVQAFYKEEDSISFDVKKVSVSTIRCYASTISKMSGNKVKCNISNGLVTVQFKLLSEREELKNKIIPLLELFKSNNEKKSFLIELAAEFIEIDTSKAPLKNTSNTISRVPETITEPTLFTYTLYGKQVSKEEYNNAERWQRLGFASQYNWENEIEGDVDMCPKDARLEDYDDDEVVNPVKFDWDSLEKEEDDGF